MGTTSSGDRGGESDGHLAALSDDELSGDHDDSHDHGCASRSAGYLSGYAWSPLRLWAPAQEECACSVLRAKPASDTGLPERVSARLDALLKHGSPPGTAVCSCDRAGADCAAGAYLVDDRDDCCRNAWVRPIARCGGRRCRGHEHRQQNPSRDGTPTRRWHASATASPPGRDVVVLANRGPLDRWLVHRIRPLAVAAAASDRADIPVRIRRPLSVLSIAVGAAAARRVSVLAAFAGTLAPRSRIARWLRSFSGVGRH
jgi:hypothetical protein